MAARDHVTTELVIVGAGPAGVSGALWAHSLGIATRIIERACMIGGQLQLVHFHPRELAGIAAGAGPEIAATYAAQLAALGLKPELDVEAMGLEPRDGGAAVQLARGAPIAARAVMVATGLSRRRLGVPGEAELEGAGVSYSARRDVVVVGGGDGAYENALLLSADGGRVLLAVRGRARARPEFQARVGADSRIEVIAPARVIEIVGTRHVEAVRIEHDGQVATRPAHAIVIKIGMMPNTGWCSNLDRDSEGHVRVDARGRTSLPAVWAAGDVTRPLLPSVTTATGAAALALADIREALRGSGAGGRA